MALGKWWFSTGGGFLLTLPPWNVRQYCDFWLSELGVLVARDVAVNALQHAGP